MHLAFVDIVYDYTAARPDEPRPLGGTTSAVCFLAREMGKLGIACTFFNKIREPGEAHGIRALPLEALIDERENPAYSAFIFPGRWVEWLPRMIREKSRAPIIGWMQESAFTPELNPALDVMDGVAFVSEWVQRINRPHAKPHWRQAVLRNAMNPRFAGLFPPGTAILESKTRPPVLIYSGSTPRGAFHMPPLLDALRKHRTDFSTQIYCDCAPSRDASANKAYIDWMRGLPNIAHVGMVGQPQLAEHMKRGAILVSPNPWPETSCITLIEAMAAGLLVIASNRSVLPETAEGFAQHIAIEDKDHPTRFDMPMPYGEFATAIDEALTAWLQWPEAMEERLRAQIDHFNAHHQWQHRVQPWLDFIRSFG